MAILIPALKMLTVFRIVLASTRADAKRDMSIKIHQILAEYAKTVRIIFCDLQYENGSNADLHVYDRSQRMPRPKTK